MEPQAYRTLQKKRTSNFREDETKLLIQLWGSPHIQNKLYLTHRKAPVMRLLAANMQQRGFYRTPDEIKTRIRNLKCLYHRIKRSMQTGAGIGTVDPDWPHFKAMDDILSKRAQARRLNPYGESVFEGPRCEDIKQEVVDDIDINDDMDSYTTNSMNGSDAEFEDEAHPMPPLIPAPQSAAADRPSKDSKEEAAEPVKIAPKPMGKVQIPIRPGASAAPSAPSIPFPLLILNGLPNAAAGGVQGAAALKTGLPTCGAAAAAGSSPFNHSDMSTILKSLLDVQKEHLEVEKQRLELDKQKLEFERLVGSQLVTLLPMFGGLLQRLAFPNHDVGNSNDVESPPKKNGRKRPCPDILKDSKILRNVLEQGIKKYMMGESRSDNEEDSGIHNDDNSNASSK